MSYKITKPVRLIECFGGIGTQAMAMRNVGADFEHYRYYDFEPNAVKSYNAIHHTSFEPTDICKVTGVDLGIVDKDKYEYVLTYSFPCQSLSCAGRQAGMSKGAGTRSGLLWEVERLLDECTELPQVLVMENVIQVHAPKHIADFNLWLEKLESLGYKNYYADLNARDFNLAQNRVRCIMVSVLSDEPYEFPVGLGLSKSLDEFLESYVDAQYYLEKSRQDAYIAELKKRFGTKIIENFYKSHETMSLEKNDLNLRAVRNGLKIICASRGRAIQNDALRVNAKSKWTQHLEPNKDCTTNTITTVTKDNLLLSAVGEEYTVRNLTPKECWRIMGFCDSDFNAASSVCSKTQLYNQAGNAIALPVLEAVFAKLFDKNESVASE